MRVLTISKDDTLPTQKGEWVLLVNKCNFRRLSLGHVYRVYDKNGELFWQATEHKCVYHVVNLLEKQAEETILICECAGRMMVKENV